MAGLSLLVTTGGGAGSFLKKPMILWPRLLVGLAISGAAEATGGELYLKG